MEKIKSKAIIYTLTDKSFLCPESSIKPGEYCASLLPIFPVDPRSLYQFVIDKAGKTHSVSRKFLKKCKTISFTWKRPQFSTHHAEISLQLKILHLKLSNYAKKFDEKE